MKQMKSQENRKVENALQLNRKIQDYVVDA